MLKLHDKQNATFIVFDLKEMFLLAAARKDGLLATIDAGLVEATDGAEVSVKRVEVASEYRRGWRAQI